MAVAPEPAPVRMIEASVREIVAKLARAELSRMTVAVLVFGRMVSDRAGTARSSSTRSGLTVSVPKSMAAEVVEAEAALGNVKVAGLSEASWMLRAYSLDMV